RSRQPERAGGQVLYVASVDRYDWARPREGVSVSHRILDGDVSPVRDRARSEHPWGLPTRASEFGGTDPRTNRRHEGPMGGGPPPTCPGRLRPLAGDPRVRRAV